MNEKQKIRKNPIAKCRIEEKKMERLKQLKDENELARLDRGVTFISLNNEIFELNLIATQIWLLVDGNRTKKDVVELLAEKYNISQEEISHDVDHFLSEMNELHLIIYE